MRIIGVVKTRNEQQNEVVGQGHHVFEEISETIHTISTNIEGVRQSVIEINAEKDAIVHATHNISAISEETAASSEEVNASMQQQTVAIEEVGSATDKLNKLSNDLMGKMNHFIVE